jgi:hypothetical protein
MCVSPDSAAAVIAEVGDAGGPSNTVTQDRSSVIITYVDERYPLDLADWAGTNGHATDENAAHVIASL